MRTKTVTVVSTPHTKAWQALEQSFDNFVHVSQLNNRELLAMKAELTRLLKRVKEKRPPEATTEKAKTKLQRTFGRSIERFKNGIARCQTAWCWQVVILVTCVEAYLQNLLSTAASVDPELMCNSDQRAPYADVIAARSLEDLTNGMRVRWARGWLSDGGPTLWIKRLEKMGARGYPNNLAPHLELIWGIRHVVVHQAGVATADFVKRHPRTVAAAGDSIKVSTIQIEAFVKSVISFLEPTEQFFLRRYPSMLVSSDKAQG